MSRYAASGRLFDQAGSREADWRIVLHRPSFFNNRVLRADSRPNILARLGAIPDFWLREGEHLHSENAVAVECVFGGTQKGVWAGIPPAGKPMEVAAVLVFVFEGDGLVCEKVYFDHATVLRQLGVGA